MQIQHKASRRLAFLLNHEFGHVFPTPSEIVLLHTIWIV
jgi:hypothetical protein